MMIAWLKMQPIQSITTLMYILLDHMKGYLF